MKKVFKEDFKISNLSEDMIKTFSPIKILLKDKKFIWLFSIKHLKKIKKFVLETFFSRNEIFPLGLNGNLGLELGKTLHF